MICRTVRVGSGVAIVCGSKPRVPKCRWCGAPSTKLCDFVVSPPQQVTHKKTCDAPMCYAHARCVGVDKDYCPDHVNATAQVDSQGALFPE